MYSICNPSFITNYAFIKKNKNDCNSDDNRIEIKEFLENDILKKEVKNGSKFIVCQNNHDLIKYESDIRKCHFKHKNTTDVGGHPMSKWHAEWQSNFEHTEIWFPLKKKCHKIRRADALVYNTVLEFQHSNISKLEITRRNFDYKIHEKNVIWIIDGNDFVKIIHLPINDRYILKFEKDFWKYESFTLNEYIKHIYLNIENKIFRFNPNEVKSHMVDVNEYKTKEDFIYSLKQCINIWKDENPIQCKLYFIQRGAGSGKTFESVQLTINDKMFIKEGF